MNLEFVLVEVITVCNNPVQSNNVGIANIGAELKCLIRRQKTASNGDIIVAIVDGEEATLKRLYMDKGQVRLQPANAALSPIYPTQLEIRGVVCGVVRRFS